MVQGSSNKYRAMAVGVIHNVGNSLDDMSRLRSLAVRVGVFMGREHAKHKGRDLAGGVEAGVAAAEAAVGQGREQALTFIFVVTEELTGTPVSPLAVTAWLAGRGAIPEFGRKNEPGVATQAKKTKEQTVVRLRTQRERVPAAK